MIVKAYFTASLRGKQSLFSNYQAIVKVLKGMGYQTYSDHILKEDAAEVAIKQTEVEKKSFYRQLLSRVKAADVIVAEISHPSVSVGHEISFAMDLNKIVVVLYTEGNGSILLEGSDDKRLKMVQYDLNNLEKVLAKAIEEAKKEADVRFNFFVSPKILSYLDWVSQRKMLPRSVFLRNLIEREMKKDKEFK